MGWCFNVSFPFIRNSFSDFRDFYFQFLVLLVYNIQMQRNSCIPGFQETDPPARGRHQAVGGDPPLQMLPVRQAS